MTEEVQFELDSCQEAMQKSLERLDQELTKIRAGKSNPSMLSSVKVDYYGALTPLAQVANVSTPDAKTLTVQPWEKGMLEPISKAIIDSNLGLNPQNNGDVIIISIPALTEERRRDLTKQAKGVGEDAKVAIRSARKNANDGVKLLKDDGLPEDALKDAESKVQDLTNEFVGRVDAVIAAKDKDIMTV
jgi:ribosome recycling factor